MHDVGFGRDGHSWSLEGEAQDDLSKLAELGVQLQALLTGEAEAASQVHSPMVHLFTWSIVLA